MKRPVVAATAGALTLMLAACGNYVQPKGSGSGASAANAAKTMALKNAGCTDQITPYVTANKAKLVGSLNALELKSAPSKFVLHDLSLNITMVNSSLMVNASLEPQSATNPALVPAVNCAILPAASNGAAQQVVANIPNVVDLIHTDNPSLYDDYFNLQVSAVDSLAAGQTKNTFAPSAEAAPAAGASLQLISSHLEIIQVSANEFQIVRNDSVVSASNEDLNYLYIADYRLPTANAAPVSVVPAPQPAAAPNTAPVAPNAPAAVAVAPANPSTLTLPQLPTPNADAPPTADEASPQPQQQAAPEAAAPAQPPACVAPLIASSDGTCHDPGK